MLVSKEKFEEVIRRLHTFPVLAGDTETTSLLPYKDGKVFAIIIAESEHKAYYFNFNPREEEALLGEEEIAQFRELFADKSKTFVFHNAQFDAQALQESMNIDIKGKVFCTMVQGRIEHNDHFQYGLDSSLKRIGLSKDDRVKKYISDHKLVTETSLDDKKTTQKQMHFDQVPLDLMVEYACDDAKGAFALYKYLNASIESKPGLEKVRDNEMALHHAILRCTTRGLLIDVPYTKRAIEYERSRYYASVREFEASTGTKFVDHFKTLEKAFSGEKDKFSWGDKTATGQVNPTFDEDTLKKFSNPLAREVLKARDAKGKLNFYNAYMAFKDKHDVLHPNMNSGGTNTGRFSSNEPNMQNITSEDLMTCKGCGKGYETILEVCEKCGSNVFDKPEFLVRRAFIPRPDYCFFNPDYSSQEYRMMLDMAKMLYDAYRVRTGLPPVGLDYYELLRKIKEENYDVHQATAELVGVSRTEAKTVNFALLYGAGVDKMADQLGISSAESSDLRSKYFKALPYVQFFIKLASRTAETRGFVKNWLGRHNNMARDWAYKAPNQLIQGGCADVMKVAMVRIDEMLKGTKSHQLLSIHDEAIVEVHYSDIDKVPNRIIDIMESIYPCNYLPLTASAEWSEISLADKRKGFPTWNSNQLLRA